LRVYNYLDQTLLGPIPKDKVTVAERRDFLIERIKILNPRLNLVEEQFEFKFDDTKDYGSVELIPKPNSLYTSPVSFAYQLDLSTIVLPEADLVFDTMIFEDSSSNFSFNLFNRLKKIDPKLDFIHLKLNYGHDLTHGYEAIVPYLTSTYDYLFCGELVIDNYKIDLQKVFSRRSPRVHLFYADNEVLDDDTIKAAA